MKKTLLLIVLLVTLFPMAKSQDNAGSMLPGRGTAVVLDAGHPYFEDFEGDTDFDLINGELENQWVIGSATNNGGSKALYISNDGGTSNAYYTSGHETGVYAAKTFSLSSGRYNISYDWKAKGNGTMDFLRVALVPANVNLESGTSFPSGFSYNSVPSGWIALDGGSQLNEQSEWINHSERFSLLESETYNLVFVWRNEVSDGYNPPAAIDNICLTLISYCMPPYELTIRNITTSSATVSWTPGDASQSDFVVAYGTGTDPAEMDNISVSDTTSIAITNLSLNTRYNVYVKAVCSTTDQSDWSSRAKFTTLCEAISIPYTENLDSYTTGISTGMNVPNGYPDITLPNCWTFLNMSSNSNSYPQVFISSRSNYSVSGNALLFKASSSTYAYAIMPQFDTDLSDLMLEFYYRTEDTSNSSTQITIGYTSDPTDERVFVPMSTFERKTTMTYAKVLFPTGLDDSYQIAFRVGGGTSNDYWALLDNVSVRMVPPCTEPYVTVSDITSSSATVSWTPRNASQSAFVVAYGTGTNPAEMSSINVTNANSVSLTGLASNTDYNVFVKAVCSATEMTEWSHVGFTTDCGGVPTWRISTDTPRESRQVRVSPLAIPTSPCPTAGLFST